MTKNNINPFQRGKRPGERINDICFWLIILWTIIFTLSISHHTINLLPIPETILFWGIVTAPPLIIITWLFAMIFGKDNTP